MKNFNPMVWITMLVIAGILGGNLLGLFNINVFFEGWWTLIIIIPCFVGIFTDTEKTGDIIGLCIGLLLLLCF